MTLDRAVQLAPNGDNTGHLKLVTVKTNRSTSWSREEIYGLDECDSHSASERHRW